MVGAKTLFSAIAILCCSPLLLPAQQGLQIQELKGQVKIGRHKVKLEAGVFYEFVLDNPNDLELIVDLAEEPPLVAMSKNPREDRVFFLPEHTDNYHVYVFPGIGFPAKATLDYSVKVKPLPLAKQAKLEVKGKWTDKDDIYKREWDKYHKAYNLKMEAGKIYLLDLIDPSGNVDPYLFLEDAKGNVVAKDDDSGGDLNARLVYIPEQTGEFRIIATTLDRATGDFILKVRQVQ